MVHSLLSQLVFGLLALTCAFSFVKGGPPERWGALIIGVSWLSELAISLFFGAILSRQFQELSLLAIDAVLAIGLLAIALRFAKTWLGVAMLMQSGELALHGAAMADWGLKFRSYIVLNNVLSLGLIALLAGATVTAWLQRRRKQVDARDDQHPAPIAAA